MQSNWHNFNANVKYIQFSSYDVDKTVDITLCSLQYSVDTQWGDDGDQNVGDISSAEGQKIEDKIIKGKIKTTTEMVGKRF